MASPEQRLVKYWQQYVRPYSAHYRRTGALDQLDLNDPAATVRRVPFTRKTDLVEYGDDFLLRPQSPHAPETWESLDTESSHATDDHRADVDAIVDQSWPAEERFLREWLPIHFQRSGGTTGQSITTAYTWFDLFGPFQSGATFLYRVTGIDRRDRVFNLCPAAPHLGIYATSILPVLIGQSNFNTFGGRVLPTDEQVAIASSWGANAIIGITSYLGVWARRAASLVATGAVQPLAGVRTVVCVGEPVSDGFRDQLSEAFVAAGCIEVNIVEGMSSTELRAAGFYECSPKSGLHCDQRFTYAEVVDPATGEPLADGEPGVLVWSHIGWRGHAIARYWTGDFVHGGLAHGRCNSCGRDGPRLRGPITRWQRDFVKVRGSRVELIGLYDAIQTVETVDTFQIRINKQDPSSPLSRDLLHVTVGARHGAPSEAQSIANRVAAAVYRATEVTADDIEVASVSEVETRLFSRKLKAEHLVDERPSL